MESLHLVPTVRLAHRPAQQCTAPASGKARARHADQVEQQRRPERIRQHESDEIAVALQPADEVAHYAAVWQKLAADWLVGGTETSQQAGAPRPPDQSAIEARSRQRMQRGQCHTGVADVVWQPNQDRGHDGDRRARGSGAGGAVTGRASMAPRKNVSR